MRRKIAKFSILPVFAGCMFFSFSTREAANLEIEGYSTSNLDLNYTVALVEESELAKDQNLKRPLPALGKSYDGFKEALGFKESRGNYKTINQFGYMGKYQFGIGTLELLGIYNGAEFLSSPELQEAAFYTNASRNKWILIRDIARFEGKVINGVKVTESGILAAAHLAGPGSVKKYLRSWGAQSFSDAFGTSIRNYMRKFGGYDTSFVQPEQNPRVNIKAFRA